VDDRGDAPAEVESAHIRRPLAAIAGLVVGLVAITPRDVAAADSPISNGRVAASPEGAIATESSQVLPKWTPAAALSLSHEAGLDRPGAADMRARTGADLAIAFGMFDWIEISGQLPLVLRQRVADGASQMSTGGLGDVRAGLKGTILRLPRRGIGLGLMFDVTAPTGSATRHLGLGAPSYAPQLLFEVRGARAIRAAFALGYLARRDVTWQGRTAGDAITARTGVRVPLSPTRAIALVGELDGRIALVRGAQHALVGRFGLRGQTRAGIVIGAYATAATPTAFGTGEVGGLFSFAWSPPGRAGTERAFDGSERPRATALALRYDAVARRTPAPSGPTDPRDPDGDRVVAGDACPSAAEDRDGFEDGDGCPELDDDHDAIADAFDLCPRAPEVVNGALDVDGCPDRRDAKGTVETLTAVDWSAITPRLVFAPGTNTLSAESVASLDAWIELARLNPWITRLEVGVYIHVGAATDAGAGARDRARAQARADEILGRVRAAGLEPWRVEIRELGAVPADVDERTRVAVIGASSSSAALSPDPAALRRWIASEQATAAPDVDYAAQGPDAAHSR
jgi:hypothetical protein